eukprot:SAG31_NODE_7795_length_1594_cov_6.555184_2_plen_233_part_00
MRCDSVVLPDSEVLKLQLFSTPAYQLRNLLLKSFNYRFHNWTSAILSAEELSVLGLGLRFIPTQFGPTFKQLSSSLYEFGRLIYLRDFFARKAELGELDEHPPPPDSRLRVRNPDFHPLHSGYFGEGDDAVKYKPSFGVREYVNDVTATLVSAFSNYKETKLDDNLTAAQRAAIVSLRSRLDVVICESDKNQGLLAMCPEGREDAVRVERDGTAGQFEGMPHTVVFVLLLNV